MIINHKHRFCFFAVPRTGSKAISKVLMEELGSEKILRMHTSFDEFMKVANREESQYFTFATVRNPMDSIVSAYYKKKNDHNGRFSRGTFLKTGLPIGERAMKEYNFIKDNNADFATYFMEFYKTKYEIPRHESTVSKVDFVLRYEVLQQDFSKFLELLNLPDLKIPLYNKTKGKTRSFNTYYTPDIIGRAHDVLSPLMKKWGYDTALLDIMY